MKLEDLPNEFFHDLFEFFYPYEHIRAFEGLNERFNKLLFIYFRSYRLDFRTISKSNFYPMCQQYLPLIVDHVSSLCLSDGEDTPRLSHHLIRYNLTVDEFTHLRSLLLQNIDSTERLLYITSDCFYLPHLTHLKIIECNFTSGERPQQLITNIWRIITLTHCTLDITFNSALTFVGLPRISKSIEYLSIKQCIFSSQELAHLLYLTPSLRHLRTEFSQSVDIKLDQIFPVPLITTLQLRFNGSLLVLTSILKNLPQLQHFKIQTETINLNGNQWQQVLNDYVPRIKTFRFLMRIFSSSHNHTEEQLENFLNTFRTSFWLEDHQWFVRCNWPQHSNKIFFLYTLPYCFNDTYIIYQNRWSKSTCPPAHECDSYARITNAYYQGCIDNLAIFPRCYSNIHRLTLKLPLDKNFWNVIPTLDRLTSLNVFEMRENNRSVSQLKDLLSRTPRLHSLSVDVRLFLHLVQLDTSHGSLRRLQLKHSRANTSYYMNATQCSLLADSLLARQCEVLVIRVQYRESILGLIEKMNNLRVLNCECQGGTGDADSLLCSQNELVEWLQTSLPSTYSVTRHGARFIRIYIEW